MEREHLIDLAADRLARRLAAVKGVGAPSAPPEPRQVLRYALAERWAPDETSRWTDLRRHPGGVVDRSPVGRSDRAREERVALHP
jgi:hypothetical protein